MKMMVIGPQDPDSFADNVADTARRMGHTVIAAGPARRARGPRRVRNGLEVLSNHSPRLDTAWQRHLVATANQAQPDLVVTLDNRLRPATVADLKSSSGAIALWFPDAVSNMGNHEMFVAGYDRIFLKSPEVVTNLSRIYGVPTEYLPEAANPAWHGPRGDYGVDEHILVAGNVHPTRALLLSRLLQAGVPLRLHGPPLASWLDFPDLRAIHTGRSVVREEKARAFRGARGVLNNLHPAELSGSNCRLFEATASGATVLTEWRSGMESLFHRDREVISFDSFDTLLQQCKWLLSDRSAGQPIADAAALRTARDHTYAQRITQILTSLELR